MGSGEWGIGNWELLINILLLIYSISPVSSHSPLLPTPHSPLPTPHSLLPTPYSPLPTPPYDFTNHPIRQSYTSSKGFLG
ncbi:MAG: hypothetical protein KME64_06560 [Scytonematopsis contorta HA4267-MV1]|nr:hypothetical protein [Scytonematopsis contorta HA4267-MV1]